MEAMLRALQVHGAQQGVLQNQRASEDDNALRQATMQAGGDQNKLVQLLQDMGQYGAVQKVQKSIFDQQKGAADIDKVRADTAKQYSDIGKERLSMAEKRLNLAGQAFGWVRDNPSVEAAHAVADYLGENGIWSPEQVTQAKAKAAQNPTPEAIKALATQAYQSALSAKDQLPTYMQQTRGGTVATQQINPVTGQVQDVQSAQVTESEAQRLARERAAADAAAGRAVQIRGQNMTDARMRERMEFDRGTATSDAGGPAQVALTKQFGKPPAGYRWKQDGSLEAIPGGPTDRKANEQQAGKETVDNVVSSLRSAYESLEKGGGITSIAQGPLSNVTAAISRSGVGQTVGGALGTRNQKERDSIAQARPLLLQAIMKATGMSAKQMDSNAELKLYLATATDPTLTLEANREALDRIEQLYGSGAKPGAAPPSPATKQGTARVNSDAEYDALPSGATFVGPDGKTRRKP